MAQYQDCIFKCENGALSSIRFNSLLKNRHTHPCASSRARSPL